MGIFITVVMIYDTFCLRLYNRLRLRRSEASVDTFAYSENRREINKRSIELVFNFHSAKACVITLYLQRADLGLKVVNLLLVGDDVDFQSSSMVLGLAKLGLKSLDLLLQDRVLFHGFRHCHEVVDEVSDVG